MLCLGVKPRVAELLAQTDPVCCAGPQPDYQSSKTSLNSIRYFQQEKFTQEVGPFDLSFYYQSLTHFNGQNLTKFKRTRPSELTHVKWSLIETCKQFDQMVGIFVQFVAIYKSEDLPNSKTIVQFRLHFCLILK